MYSVGEKVVHSPEGVCIIDEIVEMDVWGEKKPFYKMHSVVEQEVVLYVSLENKKNKLRPLKTKEEVEYLLQMQPEENQFLVQNMQRRAKIQRRAILEDNSEKLMQLIKLYAQKKHNTYISIGDNLWLKHAERFLFSEIAEVMGMEYAPDNFTRI